MKEQIKQNASLEALTIKNFKKYLDYLIYRKEDYLNKVS